MEVKKDIFVTLPDKSAIEVETLRQEVRTQVVERLIAYRKELKMTQQDISDATGIHRPNVARLETGRCNPSLDVMVRVAASLGKKVVISFEDMDIKEEPKAKKEKASKSEKTKAKAKKSKKKVK